MQFDDWGQEQGQSSGKNSSVRVVPGGGGWHWLLTVIALLVVGVLSMGCAYLTRSVEERPVWMMGLIFMVPAAAMMFAAMLVEQSTSAMTPETSRKPQLILAVTATVLTFVVAVICDLIYLSAFKKPLPQAQSVLTSYEVSDRLIIVTDPTHSMEENGAHEVSAETVRTLLEQADTTWEIGMVTGSRVIPAAPLSETQKQSLTEQAEAHPDEGRLYYEETLQAALDAVESVGDGRAARVLLLTDGLHTWSRNEGLDLTERCLKDGVTVYCILMGAETDVRLEELVEKTGGKMLTPDSAAEVFAAMTRTLWRDEVSPAAVTEEKLKLDLLRNREPAAIIISGIMLLLEGLSLGICLSLMLSVSKQFRFQYILSPLMGVLAFVLLKFIWDNSDITTTWWIKEGVSFSLLGVVLMMRNRRKVQAGKAAPSQKKGKAAPASGFDLSDDF